MESNIEVNLLFEKLIKSSPAGSLMGKSIFLTLRYLVGFILLLFGMVGLVIPIVQGWILIFAGIFLINPAFARKMKEKFKGWWQRRKQKQTVFEDESP